MDEKERIFSKLYISRQINGLARTLVLRLDTDWFNAIHNAND